MQANGAWDKALKPEKLGILSNAETKLDVVNAMADLMETTPLEKLTVSQICKTSGYHVVLSTGALRTNTLSLNGISSSSILTA